MRERRRKGRAGQQADALRHRRLRRAAKGRVCEAVRWQHLPEREK